MIKPANSFSNPSDHIIDIRGTKVIIDYQLAFLYGVENRALKQQVRRNLKRFPPDFMFELSEPEVDWLVSQNVIPEKRVLGGSVPMVFTEQGVAMLSSVLRSEKALEVNIAIMRTFVQLRKMMLVNENLKSKIDKLEKKYDEKFHIVFTAIKQLVERKNEPRRAIGYKIPDKSDNP